jgi:glycosyltransferase involved in cell wall biosynthesis
MKPVRLHLLYEYGTDFRPFGSAYIRLLRPLTHPVFRDKLEVTSGCFYDGSNVDAVVVDRLWRPDVSLELVQELRQQTRKARARLLYTLDDHLLELAEKWKDWQPTKEQMRALRFLLTESDGIIVPTEALRSQLQIHNSNIAVVPNMLDDRLLDGRGTSRETHLLSLKRMLDRALAATLHAVGKGVKSPVTIGYMGTFTHDEDLLMVLPALREVCRQYKDKVALFILGVTAHPQTLAYIDRFPVRVTRLKPKQAEYPSFMRWFSRNVNWDVAISPLRRTRFNQCKSDIKMLDYSAIGAAGIYSRVPAYVETVQHRETGWLAENTVEAWFEALETLISDAKLRIRISRNANRYLHSERTVARSSDCWLEALEQLLG